MVIGDIVQGGVVFFVDETGSNGLAAYPNDLGLNQWSPTGNNTTGATGVLIGDGKSNTASIISALGEGNYAAKVCAELGDGQWYLPSLQELLLILTYQEQIGNTARYYQRWTSTEVNSTKVKVVDFSPRHTSPILEASKRIEPGQGSYFRPIRTIGSFTPFDIGQLALPQKPSAALAQVGDVGSNSATFKATYLSEGDGPLINKGIIWNTIGNPFFGNISDSKASSNLSLGEETVTINGLLSGVKYFFSTYASNKYGTYYSDPIEITTTGEARKILITTKNPEKVSFNSVTLNALIQMLASSVLFNEVGFEVSRDSEFVSFKKQVTTGNIGDITKNVTGLLPGTKYYYRPYAIIDDGVMQYGGISIFTTKAYSSSDLKLKPHLMFWQTAAEEMSESPEGYPIPGLPGEDMVTPCRFHLGGSKEFKNEDSTIVNQVGTIRIQAGQPIPNPGMMIEVEGHFSGIVRQVYRGQLSHRLEV